MAILAVINDKCFFTCCRICTPPPPHAHCPVFVYLIGRKANTNSNRKAFFVRMCTRRTEIRAIASNIYLHGLVFFIKVRFLCPFTVSAQKNDYYGVCKHRNREKHFDYHKGDLLAINYGFCEVLFRLICWV